MFESFKIKTALKFGRLEHASARILGLLLFVIFGYRFFTGKEYYLELVCTGLWLVYYLSHRLEKAFYGSGLRK